MELGSDALLWTPSAERVRRANLTAFVEDARQHAVDHEPAALYPHAGGISGYDSLRQWSIDFPEEFWAAVWRFHEVLADERCGAYLDEAGNVQYAPQLAPWDCVLIGGERMAPPQAELGPRWFTGARLNFAENMLRHCAAPDADTREALVSWNEAGRRCSLSFAELQREVARVAQALSSAGVGVGDRVAGYLPNIPEAVTAMLATASLGAVWSSCSPDFGVSGVLDRFGQIAPKVLISADGYLYGGKHIGILDRVQQIAASLPAAGAGARRPLSGARA